jgi:hypothetical protein
MGQLDSNVQSPTVGAIGLWRLISSRCSRESGRPSSCEAALAVHVQVAFESKGLNPGYHFIVSGVDIRRAFKLWASCIQRAQPHLADTSAAVRCVSAFIGSPPRRYSSAAAPATAAL